MLHVHIFLGSLYLGVSACSKKSLLIFTSGLNNKLSFRSAEFTTDYRALHSRQESRAPLLGSGQREPGKDPARSSAQICSLRLQVAHQRAPGLCKPSGSRILCRKSFFCEVKWRDFNTRKDQLPPEHSSGTQGCSFRVPVLQAGVKCQMPSEVSKGKN